MSITVSGASDDIIEIGGDITEEFYYTGDRPNAGDLLAFSDGTILRIKFDNDRGGWRITPVARGTSESVIEQAPETEEDATDRATIASAAWVVHGIGWAK
jgi:hypothetical protein